MDNVKKCEKIGILGDVRQRLGADSASDDSFDDDVNELDNDGLIAAYCAWHLGDGSWWNKMKAKFDALEDELI